MKLAKHVPLLGKAAIALVLFSAGYYFPIFTLPGAAPAAAGGTASAPSAASVSPSAPAARATP